MRPLRHFRAIFVSLLGGGSTGQGTFLIDQVIPKNAPPDVNCYSGTCQSEAVWQDPAAFSTTESEMLAECVPNH